jgi:hypothetical protein
VARALGQAKVPVEEGEEAGVAQLHPALPAVKVRQGYEELGHGVALVAEKGGEAGREVGCIHEESVSRESAPSVNARIRPLQ